MGRKAKLSSQPRKWRLEDSYQLKELAALRRYGFSFQHPHGN